MLQSGSLHMDLHGVHTHTSHHKHESMITHPPTAPPASTQICVPHQTHSHNKHAQQTHATNSRNKLTHANTRNKLTRSLVAPAAPKLILGGTRRLLKIKEKPYQIRQLKSDNLGISELAKTCTQKTSRLVWPKSSQLERRANW